MKKLSLALIWVASATLLQLLYPTVALAVEIENATVRLPLPGKSVSAGYFSIRNTTEQEQRLIAVTSPQFGLIELHRHAMKDGMMQMMAVEQISVPAAQVVHLQPGGLHLMLFRPVAPLTLGGQVELNLQWANGRSQQVVATVTRIPIK